MIFRHENPILGPSTTVEELSGYGAGNPQAANYKPTTREMVDVTIQAAAQHVTQWVYQAPWKCQIIAVHENHTVASSSGTLDVVRITADSIAPSSSYGANIIQILNAGAMSTAGTANTRQNLALKAGSGLILNPGDQIAVVAGGTATGYAGGIVQIEIAQLG
jgi:hypothetical protein